VFVHDDYVVGEVNKGFYYVSEALDFERFTLYTVSAYVRKYEALRDAVRQAEREGKTLKDDPIVRQRIAWFATQIHVAKMHMMRVVSKAAAGEVPNIESSMFKLWTTTLGQRFADEFMTMNGAAGVLKKNQPNAPANGRFEHIYRYSVVDTVGAGTSEVQKNILARRGLGLPVEN
jgi:alkylation response protein AidB-like acyl-CoA dehydrogenase